MTNSLQSGGLRGYPGVHANVQYCCLTVLYYLLKSQNAGFRALEDQENTKEQLAV